MPLDSEELVDLRTSPPAYHRDPVDAPPFKLRAPGVFRFRARKNASPIDLVQTLDPAGQIRRVTNYRISKPFRSSDIAHQHLSGMQANPSSEKPAAAQVLLWSQSEKLFLNFQRGSACHLSMIGHLLRRPEKCDDTVTDELVKRTTEFVLNNVGDQLEIISQLLHHLSRAGFFADLGEL